MRHFRNGLIFLFLGVLIASCYANPAERSAETNDDARDEDSTTEATNIGSLTSDESSSGSDDCSDSSGSTSESDESQSSTTENYSSSTDSSRNSESSESYSDSSSRCRARYSTTESATETNAAENTSD